MLFFVESENRFGHGLDIFHLMNRHARVLFNKTHDEQQNCSHTLRSLFFLIMPKHDYIKGHFTFNFFFFLVFLIQFTETVTHMESPDLFDNTPFIWCQIKLLLSFKSEIPCCSMVICACYRRR